MNLPILLASLAPLPPTAQAAEALTPLVVAGDPVPGVGLVTAIEHVRINDKGTWLVLVDTDFPDPSRDGVVLYLGPAGPPLVLVGPPSVGLPTPFPVQVPHDPSFAGSTVFCQGLYFDLSGLTGQEFRASNGLEATLAP